jgi:flagellar protein FliO/FliZ
LGGEKLKHIIVVFFVLCFFAAQPSVLVSQEQVAQSGDNQEILIPQNDEASPSDNVLPTIDEERFVFADDAAVSAENAEGAQQPIGGSSFFLILRMLLVLLLAAAGIYGLVYFVKKLSNPKKLEDPYLKVLSSASLGPSRSVHVISLGGKAWLIGSADNSVSLISEIDDKETIDAMLLDNSRNNASNKFIDFRSLFMRLSAAQDDDSYARNVPKSESLKERRKRFKGF